MAIALLSILLGKYFVKKNNVFNYISIESD